MSKNVVFKSVRLNDKQALEGFLSIASDMSDAPFRLRFYVCDGANSIDIPLLEYDKNSVLKAAIVLNSSSVYRFVLTKNLNNSNRDLISLTRKNGELFDEVSSSMSDQPGEMSQEYFIKLVASAKKYLKEIKFDENLSGYGSEETTKYINAHIAVLGRLEKMNEDLLLMHQKKSQELDGEYSKKLAKLEDDFGRSQKDLLAEHNKKLTALQQSEEVFAKKAASFETMDSKYLRRQHRQDMLKKTGELSTKFELTAGTQRLRWSVYVSTITVALIFGGLTAWSLYELMGLLAAVDDYTKLNVGLLVVMSVKQIGFAAAFLGAIWFFIKWNDKWFRQHADAEFSIKQLELDMIRASWVVEMALEWKKENNGELPPELMDRLARNLFKDTKTEDDDKPRSPDLASLLLGSASSLKLKAPSGTEVEIDRKGLGEIAKNSRQSD
jgi:hypothetical protein